MPWGRPCSSRKISGGFGYVPTRSVVAASSGAGAASKTPARTARAASADTLRPDPECLLAQRLGFSDAAHPSELVTALPERPSEVGAEARKIGRGLEDAAKRRERVFVSALLHIQLAEIGQRRPEIWIQAQGVLILSFRLGGVPFDLEERTEVAARHGVLSKRDGPPEGCPRLLPSVLVHEGKRQVVEADRAFRVCLDRPAPEALGVSPSTRLHPGGRAEAHENQCGSGETDSTYQRTQSTARCCA